LRFYDELPLQGVMIYAEPGDWGTYELNHYVLGKLAWDTDVDVGRLVRVFCGNRYGAEGPDLAVQTHEAVAALGDTVRTFGSLPFTRMKSPAEIDAARAKLEQIATRLPKEGGAFKRLHLMYDYAIRDLEIQHARANKAPDAEVRKRVDALLAFLTEHQDEGVFLLTGRNDLDRFLKRYGLTMAPGTSAGAPDEPPARNEPNSEHQQAPDPDARPTPQVPSDEGDATPASSHEVRCDVPRPDALPATPVVLAPPGAERAPAPIGPGGASTPGVRAEQTRRGYDPPS
jgi:hypothetical protein